jgi:hypothetical protein
MGLRNFYSEPVRVTKSRRLRWAGNGIYGKNAHKIVVGKREWKTPHGKLGVDKRIILRLILKKILCEGVESIHRAQDRVQRRGLVNMVIHFHVP